MPELSATPPERQPDRVLQETFHTLPPHVQEDVAQYYLHQFKRHIGDLLHTVFYRAMHVGMECRRGAARVADAGFRQEFEAAGKALEQQIADARQISARMAEVPANQAPRFLQAVVQPYLAGLQETANGGFALNRRLIELCEAQGGSKLDCDRTNLSNGIDLFNEQLRCLAYFAGRQPELVDLNETVERFRRFIPDIAYSPEQPLARCVPHDLNFVLARFFGLLAHGKREAIHSTLTERAGGNGIFAELSGDLEGSAAREIIDAAFVSEDLGTLAVSDEGVTFKWRVTKPLRACLEPTVKLINAALRPANDLLRLQNGELALSYDAASGDLYFAVNLLCVTDKKAARLAQLEARLEAEERHPPYPAAMRQVTLFRECTLHDGTKKLYDVSFQYAALSSAENWTNVVQTLQHTDEFVAGCAGLKAVSFMATGGEEAIVETYRTAAYDVDVRNAQLYPVFETPEEGIGQFNFSDLYPWKPEPHPLDARGGMEDILPLADGVYCVQAGAAELEAAPLRKAALRVCRLAHPIQLSLRHDQEQRYSETTVYHPLVGEMLRDLERVLIELRSRQGEKPLAFMLMNVVSFYAAQIGKGDELYSLQVYDEKRNLIASGNFSRARHRFLWKEHDAAVESDAIGRVERALETFRAEQHVELEDLEEHLLNANIYLPRSSVAALSDALNQVSHDRYFSAPSPRQVLHNLMRRADISIDCTPEKLKITRSRKTELAS